jgi:hypothetical protein
MFLLNKEDFINKICILKKIYNKLSLIYFFSLIIDIKIILITLNF